MNATFVIRTSRAYAHVRSKVTGERTYVSVSGRAWFVSVFGGIFRFEAEACGGKVNG